jgi:hypothetical protein
MIDDLSENKEAKKILKRKKEKREKVVPKCTSNLEKT